MDGAADLRMTMPVGVTCVIKNPHMYFHLQPANKDLPIVFFHLQAANEKIL
jgi:hypothetical protein